MVGVHLAEHLRCGLPARRGWLFFRCDRGRPERTPWFFWVFFLSSFMALALARSPSWAARCLAALPAPCSSGRSAGRHVGWLSSSCGATCAPGMSPRSPLYAYLRWHNQLCLSLRVQRKTPSAFSSCSVYSSCARAPTPRGPPDLRIHPPLRRAPVGGRPSPVALALATEQQTALIPGGALTPGR